ncbi:MAG: hypothetical protein QGD89_04760 [Actinomycetota bacterium]|nr:hypothetical protein [Actinomycetota bacterium]
MCSTGGSGLGLAIVREIVEGEEGSVTVAEAPTGGARFELRLPGSWVCADAPGLRRAGRPGSQRGTQVGWDAGEGVSDYDRCTEV